MSAKDVPFQVSLASNMSEERGLQRLSQSEALSRDEGRMKNHSLVNILTPSK